MTRGAGLYGSRAKKEARGERSNCFLFSAPPPSPRGAGTQLLLQTRVHSQKRRVAVEPNLGTRGIGDWTTDGGTTDGIVSSTNHYDYQFTKVITGTIDFDATPRPHGEFITHARAVDICGVDGDGRTVSPSDGQTAATSPTSSNNSALSTAFATSGARCRPRDANSRLDDDPHRVASTYIPVPLKHLQNTTYCIEPASARFTVVLVVQPVFATISA